MQPDLNYKPEPGSLPARVLELFARQPDEEFTSGDLALKFELRSANITTSLAEPLRHGLLVHSRNAFESAKVWRAGPQLLPWLTAQAPRTPAAAPKQGRGGRRVQLPPLDAAALPVEAGVPVPPVQRFATRGASKYDPVFAGLEVGQRRRVPAVYPATLVTAIKKRHKAGPQRYVIRRISPTETSVWRTA